MYVPTYFGIDKISRLSIGLLVHINTNHNAAQVGKLDGQLLTNTMARTRHLEIKPIRYW